MKKMIDVIVISSLLDELMSCSLIIYTSYYQDSGGNENQHI